MRAAVLAFTVALTLGMSFADAADTLVTKPSLHSCVLTRISQLGSRLDSNPESGSGVMYANGVVGVAYDIVRAIQLSRVGDPVRICLIAIAPGCPKGDGETYSALNLRTHGKWTLPNNVHVCDGY
jgi:hypothetical protein